MNWKFALALALGIWVGNTFAHTFFWHRSWYHGFCVGAIAAAIFLPGYIILMKRAMRNE